MKKGCSAASVEQGPLGHPHLPKLIKATRALVPLQTCAVRLPCELLCTSQNKMQTEVQLVELSRHTSFQRLAPDGCVN